MQFEIYQVDSFTRDAFKGNPAGVCITTEPLSEDLMRAIAAEMAVSETAFLNTTDLSLRWFTPLVEVALCGHGTLAAAHVMQQKGLVTTGQTLRFNTLSGVLVAKILDKGIELDFPVPTVITQEIDPRLLEHLGIETEQVVQSCVFDGKQLVEIESQAALLSLTPNFAALKDLPGRGIVVTARAASEDIEKLDFISRYFAPWVGVDEDPVTGSAHCALSLYWAKKLGKTRFSAYQASSRGGYLTTELLTENRVKLIGNAKTVISGMLSV